PPVASGALPILGHLLELRRDPLRFMTRVHDECGEIGEFDLAGNRVVLLYGAEAQEAFFRAPDEQLDQAAAYPFMKPVFGPGVVFDATPEQRKQAMRNQSLRDQFMRGHAETIAAEVERMTSGWRAGGEFDVLDFFSELTIYTSSAALVGKEFREELGPEYVPLFKDLERGTDAFAYVNPYLPLPAFWRRDRARKKLVAMLRAIFARREREGKEYRDLFQVLHGLRDDGGGRRYTDEQITGMFISLMFAGHHTSSVVASWALLDLLLHPDWLARIQRELEEIYADGSEVSYQALREIPLLESCLKETLRLHPPLIILMRKVVSDFRYKHWTVPAGHTVATSPAVSNRMPQHFPEPERYDPTRYAKGREEDKQSFAWIPFGAGRHRCVGAAFAMMQLKAIFSILLRRYDFELAQPRESYGNDYSKLVVAVRQPCRLRYRERAAGARTRSAAGPAREEAALRPYCVRVDLDLCQGHGVCANEAPDVFAVDETEFKVRVLQERPGPEQRPAVESAQRHCPTRAIALIED
ncbi:MAG: cytochrome P450, partial [Myxococcota bacterium]